MRLFLIRHCESENNALWSLTGSSHGRSADPLLTPKGQAQAAVLAGFLAANQEPSPTAHAGGPLRDGFRITHLYCSLMQRAVQTGAPVALALNLPLVAWPDIHERGGIYLAEPESGEPIGLPGPGRAFFAENFPFLRLPDTLSDVGWWSRPYEDHPGALARANKVLQLLHERHGQRDDGVAIITHGGFTQSLLQTLFGFSENGTAVAADRLIWFKANNAAITRIDLSQELLRLTYLNYIDYMPGHLLT